MALMETPLLKGGPNQEDQTSPASCGSTGSKQDNSKKPSPAASPADGQDVILAVNPNAREAYRVKLYCKCSSTETKITQGLLNFALLTANASQLMAVLGGGSSQFCFDILVIMISLSIIVQIIVGAVMFYAATLDTNNDQLEEKYEMLNIAAAALAWVVIFCNVFILVFGRQDYTFAWKFIPM